MKWMKYQKKKYTEKLQHEEVNEEKEEVKKKKKEYTSIDTKKTKKNEVK